MHTVFEPTFAPPKNDLEILEMRCVQPPPSLPDLAKWTHSRMEVTLETVVLGETHCATKDDAKPTALWANGQPGFLWEQDTKRWCAPFNELLNAPKDADHALDLVVEFLKTRGWYVTSKTTWQGCKTTRICMEHVELKWLLAVKKRGVTPIDMQ